MYNSYPNYSMYNNYRMPNYYDAYTPQNNYNLPIQNQQSQQPVMNNQQPIMNNQQPIPQNNNMVGDMIKGRYVNSLNEVIELSSTTYEPFICVDFNSQKIYIKTFNIDGSYTIEEFAKNPNAKIDTRNQTEKLADTVSILANEVIEMKKQLNVMNNMNTMNNGGTINNEQPTKQSKSKLS